MVRVNVVYYNACNAILPRESIENTYFAHNGNLSGGDIIGRLRGNGLLSNLIGMQITTYFLSVLLLGRERETNSTIYTHRRQYTTLNVLSGRS